MTLPVEDAPVHTTSGPARTALDRVLAAEPDLLSALQHGSPTVDEPEADVRRSQRISSLIPPISACGSLLKLAAFAALALAFRHLLT